MPRARTYSESAAWEAILGLLDQAGRASSAHERRTQLTRAQELAATMLAQVESGVHENPPLVIWPNPGGSMRITIEDMLSRRAYELAYKHRQDGLDYKHDFSAGVDVLSVVLGGDTEAKAVLLTRRDGLPLWKYF